MAGATNRAFKAAGIPKAAIKELRVTGSRGMSLRSAISLAGERGIAIGDKAKAHLAARDRKAASSPEGQAAAVDFRAKAAAGLKSMAERKAALQAARQQRVGKSLGAAMQVARGMRQKQAAEAAKAKPTARPFDAATHKGKVAKLLAKAERNQEWTAKQKKDAEKDYARSKTTAERDANFGALRRAEAQHTKSLARTARARAMMTRANARTAASSGSPPLGQRAVRSGTRFGNYVVSDASSKQVTLKYRPEGGGVVTGSKSLGGSTVVYRWDGTGYRSGSNYLR